MRTFRMAAIWDCVSPRRSMMLCRWPGLPSPLRLLSPEPPLAAEALSGVAAPPPAAASPAIDPIGDGALLGFEFCKGDPTASLSASCSPADGRSPCACCIHWYFAVFRLTTSSDSDELQVAPRIRRSDGARCRRPTHCRRLHSWEAPAPAATPATPFPGSAAPALPRTCTTAAAAQCTFGPCERPGMPKSCRPGLGGWPLIPGCSRLCKPGQTITVGSQLHMASVPKQQLKLRMPHLGVDCPAVRLVHVDQRVVGF